MCKNLQRNLAFILYYNLISKKICFFLKSKNHKTNLSYRVNPIKIIIKKGCKNNSDNKFQFEQVEESSKSLNSICFKDIFLICMINKNHTRIEKQTSTAKRKLKKINESQETNFKKKGQG